MSSRVSQVNQVMKIGGVQDTPLILFQPFNLIVFLSFYSPIILATSLVGLSFVFQNFKGFIYLGFLLGACVVREYIYRMVGSSPIINDRTICTSIQYSQYGNPTFSAFVFAFTIMYLSLPMFVNDSVNFWVFSSILVYFLLDMFIKIYKGCIVKMGDLFLNVLLGVFSSALIVSLMWTGGSGKYLFFNEVSSNKEICSQPKEQTFRCSLYKNGELISGTN
jgi:hypothetical protein